MKKYTVYGTYERIPFIRLSGKWLKEYGFEIGDKFNLVYENGKLILTRINKEKN